MPRRVWVAWQTRVSPPSKLWLGVALILGLGLLVPVVLLTRDTPALDYRNVPFPVQDRTLRPGEVVVAYTERCNRFDRTAPYHYVRKLAAIGGDARANVLVEGQGFAPPGCVYAWVPLLTLPATTVPGAYRVEALNVVNGQWRSFEVGWTTEAFDVVPP